MHFELPVPEEFFFIMRKDAPARNACFQCAILLYDYLYTGIKKLDRKVTKTEAKNHLFEQLNSEGYEKIDIGSYFKDLLDSKWIIEGYDGIYETISIPAYARPIILSLKEVQTLSTSRQVSYFRDIVIRLNGLFNGPYAWDEMEESLENILDDERLLASNIKSLTDDYATKFEEILQKETGNNLLREILEKYEQDEKNTDKHFQVLEYRFEDLISAQEEKWLDEREKVLLQQNEELHNKYTRYISLIRMIKAEEEEIDRNYKNANLERTRLLKKAKCQWEYIEQIKKTGEESDLKVIIGKIVKLLKAGIEEKEITDITDKIYLFYNKDTYIFDKEPRKKRDLVKKKTLESYTGVRQRSEVVILNEEICEEWREFEKQHTHNGIFSISAEEITKKEDVDLLTTLFINRFGRPDIHINEYTETPYFGISKVSWEYKEET